MQPGWDGWALRLLAFRNIARMGRHRDALARAQQDGHPPDIRADDRPGRHKYGNAANVELPLADDGDTGLFARLGWNDGRTESFVFTEADRLLGDGRLDYRRERIVELYYRLQLLPHRQLGPDLQWIRNPGYDRDRGPARFVGLRAHLKL